MDISTLKQTIASLDFANHADIRAAAALPGILDAIVDAVADAATPIVLSGDISQATTQDDLNEVGLTVEEIKAASEGKRSAVYYNNNYYPICKAFFSESSYVLNFVQCTYSDTTAELLGISGYQIFMEEGVLTVEEVDA